MKEEDCFQFPRREPEPGECVRVKDGGEYLAFESLATPRCDDCDLATTLDVDEDDCPYRDLCSPFVRKDAKSLAFQRIKNFDDALTNSLLTRETPLDVERFETGATKEREDGKPRLDLISPLAELRLAKHLARGAEKYSARNWEKGLPTSRCLSSALRHLNAYRRGEYDEDHLVAAFCNLMFLLHFEEACKLGLLPLKILDLPRYRKTEKRNDANERTRK